MKKLILLLFIPLVSFGQNYDKILQASLDNELGITAAEDGEFYKAIDYLESAARGLPSPEWDTYYFLGFSYYNTKKFDLALKNYLLSYESIDASNENKFMVSGAIATIYYNSKMYEKAIEYLSNSIDELRGLNFNGTRNKQLASIYYFRASAKYASNDSFCSDLLMTIDFNQDFEISELFRLCNINEDFKYLNISDELDIDMGLMPVEYGRSYFTFLSKDGNKLMEINVLESDEKHKSNFNQFGYPTDKVLETEKKLYNDGSFKNEIFLEFSGSDEFAESYTYTLKAFFKYQNKSIIIWSYLIKGNSGYTKSDYKESKKELEDLIKFIHTRKSNISNYGEIAKLR